VPTHRNWRNLPIVGGGPERNATYFGILHKLWGGPPGPRGSPWTRFFQWNQVSARYKKADEGVRRGPGLRPTAKVSGIWPGACSKMLLFSPLETVPSSLCHTVDGAYLVMLLARRGAK